MVFGSKHFKAQAGLPGWLSNSGEVCPLTKSTRILGFHVDDKLSFDEHVSKVVTSCYLILRNLHQIRKFLNKDSAASAIHAFITSKLDTCDSLFFGMTAQNIAKLQHVQNFAARVVCGRPARTSSAPLLRELHWLNVEQRIHFKLLVLVFRCLNSSAPCLLAEKLVITCPFDMQLAASTFRPLTSVGKRAFSYNAPRCWNALPRALRVCPSLEPFKAQLKTYFFASFSSYLHSVNPYS